MKPFKKKEFLFCFWCFNIHKYLKHDFFSFLLISSTTAKHEHIHLMYNKHCTNNIQNRIDSGKNDPKPIKWFIIKWVDLLRLFFIQILIFNSLHIIFIFVIFKTTNLWDIYVNFWNALNRENDEPEWARAINSALMQLRCFVFIWWIFTRNVYRDTILCVLVFTCVCMVKALRKTK